MNKKSAFQWGGGFEGGRKIDSGNIAGLGGVMRVLVVRGAARRPLCYHHLGALRTNQHSSSANRAAQFSSAQDESISASFLSRERFFGGKAEALLFFTFSAAICALVSSYFLSVYNTYKMMLTASYFSYLILHNKVYFLSFSLFPYITISSLALFLYGNGWKFILRAQQQHNPILQQSPRCEICSALMCSAGANLCS